MAGAFKAAELIMSCRRGVALTGAGISAESGISTYRDTGGLWDRYNEGATGGMQGILAKYPEEAPKILNDFFSRLKNSRPNPAHKALSELEKMGYLRAVITQNVDNLHREAGNTRVYELHGNLFRLRCLQCGAKINLDREALFGMIDEVLEKLKHFSLSGMRRYFPVCPCGGTTRLDFVSFGEPVQDLNEALAEALSCDFMLVVGTSGVVHPAASLPRKAKSNGAFLIEINTKESELTKGCDLFIQGQAGDIFPKIISALKDPDLSKHREEI